MTAGPGPDFPDQQLQEIGLVNGATHDLPPCTVSGAVETPVAAPIILRRRRPVNSIGAARLSPVPPGADGAHRGPSGNPYTLE